MAGGRIAEYDESQERVEVMRNAGSRARADAPLPAVLRIRPAVLLDLQPAARRAGFVRARLVLGDVALVPALS